MFFCRVCCCLGMLGAVALGELAADDSTLSQHWAYRAPVRPSLPDGVDEGNSSGAIDRFIRARLHAEKLTPAKPATREAQLRRVTFDLIGLPPTIAELRDFLMDPAPDAYERVVDRLLASPRFGERFGQDWLDLARYADTHGYHADTHRDMWRWREWVIDAINRNEPFDRFTIEQLAGDLLPNATIAQRIATGFNRNNMVNHENGAIAEEYRTEYVVDRVATTGAVWLGQTWACARCHDHKYDPLSQRDFYRLFAYFNNVPENGLDGRTGNAAPYISAPSEEQQRELSDLEAQLAALNVAIKSRAESCDKDFAAWQRDAASQKDARLPPDDMSAYFPLEESSHDEAPDSVAKDRVGKIRGSATFVAGKFGEALLFDGSTHVVLGDVLALDRATPLTLSVWMFATSEEHGTLLSRVEEAFTSRGLTLAWEDRRLIVRLCNDADNQIGVATKSQLPLSTWQHVAVTWDGSGQAAGIAIYVDGNKLPLETKADSLTRSIFTRRPWQLGQRDDQDPWRGMLDEVRLYPRALAAEEVALLSGGDPLRAILAKPAAARSTAEVAQLKRYFLQQHDAVSRDLSARYTAATRAKQHLLLAIPTTMVMEEMSAPRQTHVLERGAYDHPREQVSPGLPEQLLPASPELPANRLGLAQWLMDPRHPLTARVAVHRYWAHCFGRGLVATPEDFGLRGSPPSHPELLDWLAVEFRESGWDVKQLLRSIVTSDTYRQSSAASPELRERDPHNVLLARGPQVRLPAEMIRDSALSASTLLHERIGGPSVNPYQPADLWKDISYDATQYTAQTFNPGRGSELYRRSVYTFWKRAAPHPVLTAFDAPNRETCVIARPTSHSPQQALALLNDVGFVEAARALGERAMRKAGSSAALRLDFIYRAALTRLPTNEERARLLQLFGEQLAAYQADPAAAKAAVTVGESRASEKLDVAQLAAWASVAMAVFNLEEFVMK